MYILVYLFVFCSLFNTTIFCDIAGYEYNEFSDVESINIEKSIETNKRSKSVKHISNECLDIKSKDLTLLNYYCKAQNSSCIATLVDKDGNKFILKQKLNTPISSALETLAGHIACFAGIPANKIKLIPCNVPFVGKKKLHKPATLHTFVPGVLVNRVSLITSQYAVSLQLVEKERKGDKIIEEVFGITRDIIRNMSVHSDLPKIVALDTFLANHDRHRGNLFYDEETDHFYVIDLEGSFGRDLAKLIYEYFLMVLSKKNIIFSKGEIKALVIYRAMLKKLIAEYNPEKISAQLDKLIKETQMVQTKESLLRISGYHKKIEANYNSCIKVVDILNVLLKKYHQ